MSESLAQTVKEVAADAGGQVLGATGLAKPSNIDKEPGQHAEGEQKENGGAKHDLENKAEGGDEKRQKVDSEDKESPALKESLEGLQQSREEKDQLTENLEETAKVEKTGADGVEAAAPAGEDPKEGDVEELNKAGEENEKSQAKIQESEKKLESKAAASKDTPNKAAAVKRGA